MKDKMFDFKAAVRDAVKQVRAERAHGEWVWSADEDGESWICSECMESFTTDDVGDFPKWAHFCPNCGAEMRAMTKGEVLNMHGIRMSRGDVSEEVTPEFVDFVKRMLGLAEHLHELADDEDDV